MSQTALMTRDDGRRLASFNSTAVGLRDDAIADLSIIGRVTNTEEQEVAVAAVSKAKGHKSEVEKARKDCKAPILDFCKLIDEVAKRHIDPLDPEILRVEKMLADYQQAEIAKARAAEAAKKLEEQRIEQARQAELARIAAEERAARQKLEAEQAEAERKIREAKSEAARKEAEQLAADVRRQQELAEAQTLAQRDAINSRADEEAKAIAAPIVPVQSKGQINREVWEIERIDSFILAKARPDLVRKIEFDILAIKALLNAGEKLPGVTAKKGFVSTARAERPLVLSV